MIITFAISKQLQKSMYGLLSVFVVERYFSNWALKRRHPLLIEQGQSPEIMSQFECFVAYAFKYLHRFRLVRGKLTPKYLNIRRWKITFLVKEAGSSTNYSSNLLFFSRYYLFNNKLSLILVMRKHIYFNFLTYLTIAISLYKALLLKEINKHVM